MKDLPQFKRRQRDAVARFLIPVFMRPSQTESHFRRLIEYEDGHYGAVFSLGYFGLDTPTKSQWNSLKKKLKRHDKQVFVFKEHTLAPCSPSELEPRCGLIEFGFFAHEPESKNARS